MVKLSLNGLSKRFGELEVLREINVAIDRGAFISLVGPSGCGKTTLLRLVAGLEPASSGAVLLDRRAVGAPGVNRGFVFQTDNLLPSRPVFAKPPPAPATPCHPLPAQNRALPSLRRSFH